MDLAHDVRGAGHPVVLIHGLTFDRSTWQPVVDALGGSVQTIAVDLPAHGESGGLPASAGEVAERIHGLTTGLGLARPVVVGHSYGVAVAAAYAADHPTGGLLMCDSGPSIQAFAELTQRLAPALRGPGFGEAWQMFEASLGLDRIPEPAQSLVRRGHRVDQDVVLGYWHQMLTTPPAEFQAWVDATFARVQVPVLAIFGSPVSDEDRDRLARLPDVRLEEHPGEGHFTHLVDPARFARALREFVEHCAGAAQRDLRASPLTGG